MTLVYRHRRLDTNEIFYVGIERTGIVINCNRKHKITNSN